MISPEQVLSQGIREDLIALSERLVRQEGERGLVEGLDEIAGILGKYDPAPSPILNALDQKAQDLATYFFAAYSSTRDLERSLFVYKTVKSLVRYVMLIDRFYEVGNKKYERMARGVLRSVKKVQRGHMKYSLDFLLKRSWPFMDYEQVVRKHMLRGHTFAFKEVRHYNLFKASDAPMIYSHVLDAELSDFNQNVAAVMHYNQALQDVYDDFADIEEDLHDMMPNTFILAATERAIFSQMQKNPAQARKLIIYSGAVDVVLSLVDQYNTMIKEITIPRSFAFLKHLSRDYTNRLLKELDILPG